MTREEKQAERAEEFRRRRALDAPICLNCKNYHPHFNEDGTMLNAGHCARPRLKYKYEWESCEHFEARIHGEEAEQMRQEIDRYKRDKAELEERVHTLREKYGAEVYRHLW